MERKRLLKLLFLLQVLCFPSSIFAQKTVRIGSTKNGHSLDFASDISLAGSNVLEKMDSFCQQEIAVNGAKGGNWMAVASCSSCGSGGSPIHAIDRMAAANPDSNNNYVRIHDAISIATGRSQLFNGASTSLNNPTRAWDGSSVGYLQTGTNSFGKQSGNDCNNWSVATSSFQYTYGYDSFSDSKWIEESTASCNGIIQEVICFEVFSGSGGGDPHFKGFDGSKYNFDGEDNKVFSIISDIDFNLNSLFQKKDIQGIIGTWMVEFGFVSSDISIIFSPISGVSVNNKDILREQGSYSFNSTSILISTNKDNNQITSITIQTEKVTLVFKVNYFTDSNDKQDFYIDLQVELLQYPINPHGVLGQTARFMMTSAKSDPMTSQDSKQQQPFSLEGEEKDYIVSDGIIGSKFTFNRFNKENNEEGIRMKLNKPVSASFSLVL